MSENVLKVLHKQATKTESEWQTQNPIIPQGVMAFSSDKNGMYKIGNGTSYWNELNYAFDTQKLNAINICMLKNITITTSLWTDNSVYIKSDQIYDDSIIDIYYAYDSFGVVEDSDISYTLGNGYIKLTCTEIPYSDIVIDNITIDNSDITKTSEVSGALD